MTALTGADLASAALSYQGIPYLWGGHLPSTGWDCSGFTNYILGHHFGLTLPGGVRYSGRSHGPIAATYKVWTKATTVGNASPGVLCCWLTHIGIALNGHQMISAYDRQLGTAVTGFSGPPGEPLSFRRVNLMAAAAGGTSPAGTVNKLSGCLPGLLLAPLLLVREVTGRGRHATSEPESGD